MLKLHSLKNNYVRKKRKRVGRGEGGNWGKTSGRGHKGQYARSGVSIRLHFEGGQIPLFRRLPKKGFNNPNHKDYTLVNVAALEKHYDVNDMIDIESLRAKGIIKKVKFGVKVLGNGTLTKAFTVKAHRFSEGAMQKIEAAGGTCQTI